MPKNEAERAAQERYKVPIDKAGLDYIARPMDKEKFDGNFDKAFPDAFVPFWKRKKNNGDDTPGDKEDDSS